MIRPTCANCNIELTCEKNEIPAIHFMNNNQKNGIDELRYGDRWVCEKCGCQIIIGMGGVVFGNDLTEKHKKHIMESEFVEVKR